MYKLIIVDDEFLVRLGVKSYIQSGGKEYEVVGTFANGKEALDFCLKTKPDIVLTDLKMPVMDGLQFIRELKEADLEIRIVVLSCYDDYKLVKTAFKLGVDDYVLKHEVEMDDLLKVLEKVKPGGKRDYGTVVAPASKRADTETERSSTLQAILNRENADIYPEGLKGGIFRCHLETFLSNYIVVCMVLDKEYDSHFQTVKREIEVLPFINTIREIVNKYGDGEVCLNEKWEFVLIISFHKIKSARGREEKTHYIVESLRETMKNFFNTSVSLGISNPHHGVDYLKEAYAEAHEALLHGFYCSEGSVFYHGQAGTFGCIDYNQWVKELKSRLTMNEDCQFEIEGVRSFFKNFFRFAVEQKISPGNVKKVINIFIHIIQNLTMNYYDLSFEEIFGNNFVAYKQIEELDRFHLLKDWVMYFLSEVGDRLQKKAGDTERIFRIKRYIEGNYGKNLTLKHVSAVFHLNMNYFCQYFKKETGKNFINYLNEVRIEKAKKLLKSSELSTWEVAEKVGFHNTNYFGKVFKKVTGLSISEYRRRP